MLIRFFKNIGFALRVSKLIERVALNDDHSGSKQFRVLYDQIDIINPDNPSYIDFFLIGMFLDNHNLKLVRTYYLSFCSGVSHNEYYNVNEIKFLQKYALNLLWLSRGRQLNSCLLKILDGLQIDESKVRQILKNRFKTADYTASNIEYYTKL